MIMGSREKVFRAGSKMQLVRNCILRHIFNESFQSYYYLIISIQEHFSWTGVHCEEHHGAALLCVLVSQLKNDQLWCRRCRGPHSNLTPMIICCILLNLRQISFSYHML